MIRIALLGGPGSGKSTQAADFFATLRDRSYKIELITEFAREAINKNLLHGKPWTQMMIYDEQRWREECVKDKVDYLITDSPIILSYVYAVEQAKLPDDTELLVRMYRNFIYDVFLYDHIFICAREKPYLQDGTRQQTEEEAVSIDKKIRLLLDMHKVKYYILNGIRQERTKQILDVVGIHLEPTKED